MLRGTMSLNELAVDLTCEPAEFTVHCSSESAQTFAGSYPEEADLGDLEEEVDGGAVPRTARRRPRPSEEKHKYNVHGGMLKMAHAMGDKGKPVHVAVRNALRRNHGYSAFYITGLFSFTV